MIYAVATEEDLDTDMVEALSRFFTPCSTLQSSWWSTCRSFRAMVVTMGVFMVVIMVEVMATTSMV